MNTQLLSVDPGSLGSVNLDLQSSQPGSEGAQTMMEVVPESSQGLD